MSPAAYIISFPASASSVKVEDALRAAAVLGAVSAGTTEREHFIVIERSVELERFDRLTSEWRKSGMALVRPLGP
jgi:hypothetical protein